MKKDIRKLLTKKVVINDGATGTELFKQGMTQGVSPELWCLENPKVLFSIYQDYKRAGSEIIHTASFGANRYKLKQYGVNDIKEINRKLAFLAKKAAGDNIFVAGDIGPTGTFVEPFGSLGFEEAVSIFKEQIEGLLRGGVDIFTIETMMDIQEARAALIAVKELTNKFTIVTMTYEKDGRTLNGTDPVTALITLQSLGADAVGCNCSTGPQDCLKVIKASKPYATVPLVAKPNAGMPAVIAGKTVFDMSPEKFSSFGLDFVKAGVNILGGCCGTTPEHIRKLKTKIAKLKPILPVRKSITALSCAWKSIIIEDNADLLVIGERINPTGKKDLQDDLRKGSTNLVKKLAKEQELAGAQLLDVNVGLSGIDEKITLKNVVSSLAGSMNLPLVIDSSSIEAQAAALRIYPGRALINSISYEPEKFKKLLPLAKRFGAMAIFLPVTKTQVPSKAEERISIINKMYNKAKAIGFTKDDIIVDAIAMTISSDRNAAQEALKVISWCKNTFKCKTVLGISNVSFGLPKRALINATFLSIARAYGLNLVIANPLQKEIIEVKVALDALLNKDKDLTEFIKYFNTSEGAVKKAVPENSSLQQIIFDAILEGEVTTIEANLKQALKENIALEDLVNNIMIPAINKVGQLFEKKEYFLPQLIASAQTMKLGMDYLKPYIKKDSNFNLDKRIIVILATVKGDIHDIGKNIVSLILENHGIEVIDLGKDVSAAKIIQTIKQKGSYIVGLSALMTTTMVNMKEVIDLAAKEGLACKFLLGGAVVTKDYAKSLGAEYAANGVEAVKIIKQIK